jgi:predicted ribosome quality control (RQC) complex YloA/Tae2 family protein
MRIDALTLGAVARELDHLLVGSRIDTVIAPTPHAVAIQCYGAGQNHWLLLSAHPQLARIHLLAAKPKKLVTEPSSFVMLLRKYLESGRITGVRWIEWERIIECDVRYHDGNQVTCIAEIIGKLSNVILVNESRMILGAIHPVSQAVNAYRAILPGHAYVPPPPQTRKLGDIVLPRLRPDAVTGGELSAAATEKMPVAKLLLSQLTGMSQDLAGEIACRALDDASASLVSEDNEQWEAVAAVTCEFAHRATQGKYEPVAILDGSGHIQDAALWPPCTRPDARTRRFDSVNQLLDAYFSAREWQDALGGARNDLRRTLKTVHDRLARKLAILQSELDALRESDQLRAEGELLLAFASEISPGATSYTPPDLGNGEAQRLIKLDPHLTAIDNANARFNRYHKMRRAMEQIPDQIARTEASLARIAQLQTDLEMTESLAEIAQVRDVITEARIGNLGQEERTSRLKAKPKNKSGKSGKGSTARKSMPGGSPPVLKSPDDFAVYVGKNSNQNEYVTFEVATGSDLWFHARGVPGAHVIVKSGGRPVPPETIDYAARLAAWYSQSRGASSVPVDYTEQRYIRHMKHGGPGMVIYSHERTLHAVPREG